MEKIIANVTVAGKAWKIKGFPFFHYDCVTWMQEEQHKRIGKLELEFWVLIERFPVAQLLFNNEPIVELLYYPDRQTAACLSGKTLHDSTKKMRHDNNLFALYLEAKLPIGSDGDRALARVRAGLPLVP
ncbi:MAG: hypothetical protein G01um101448_931 [Parcubacteria group bacterium Gr01-1014_48]|nr:MAG: hypothetical protein Greene041614_55 [Parcubacteria group bacterium Greene0416_14]TSC72782.1 MAG: hypothetical protein G01um101448_931 [Parcubacteria group bacterium Gr01-1014_48]TSD01495.1 MAG: hypothetical protein Greene101415_211 [Parcubacteria group bacterium Greene1014_15]TSD07912.1 MAG: hypothetical protein Greene07144_605 [Parcubacteria group bacterium Greene0714_4]